MPVRDFARAPVFAWLMRRLVLAVACAWAVLALSAAAAAAAGEPVVLTGNATAITSTSATVNGTVNPEGQATTYYFEYGTTTSYGSQTATLFVPEPALATGVWLPYPVLVPYWKT